MYTARHKGNGKQFAIKVMDRVKIKPASIVREYTVLESLGEHPSVVGYFGTYKTKTTVSFVLEHMQGGELFERLIAEGAFEESQARFTFQKVAQGLAYLHKTGIIHRDLKPENLLLKTALPDDAKIADFGLSQLIKPGERLLKVCGTWAYAAPEMSSSKKPGYSTRFDTWSFGVILYVALSGSHPFDPQGGLPVAKIKANARAARFSFDQPEWSTISDVAKDFIRRLIVKDQRKRLSSKQMLKHPWLKNVPEPTTRYRLTEDGEKIVERIRAAGSSEYDSSATPSDFEDIEPPKKPGKGKASKPQGRKDTSNTADPFGPSGGGTADTLGGGSGLGTVPGYGAVPASQTNGRHTGTISADSHTLSPRPPMALASHSDSRDARDASRSPRGSGPAPPSNLGAAHEAASRPPNALPEVSVTGEVYNSGASRRQPRAVRAVDVAMPSDLSVASKPRSFARPPVKNQQASTAATTQSTNAAVAAKATQNANVVAGKKHRQAVGKRLGRAFYKAPPITTGTVTTSVGSQDTAQESISDMSLTQRPPGGAAASGAGADAAQAGQLKYPQSSARRVRKHKRAPKDARHFRQSRGEDVMAADIAAANARDASGLTDNDSVLSMDSQAPPGGGGSGADMSASARRQQSLPTPAAHKIRPVNSGSSELAPAAERSRTSNAAGGLSDLPSAAGMNSAQTTGTKAPQASSAVRLKQQLLPASHESFASEHDGVEGGSIDIADSMSVGMHPFAPPVATAAAPAHGKTTRSGHSGDTPGVLNEHHASGARVDSSASSGAPTLRPRHGRHLSPLQGREGPGRTQPAALPAHGLPPRSPTGNVRFPEPLN